MEFNEKFTMQSIQERLREVIASATQNNQLTQAEIAKNIGVSFQTVSKYMTKDIFPALDTLAKLCAFLDVSADYILGLAEL